ncbi:division septum protein Blr, partial [Leptospira borgpetersenii serovar Hardjo-bovis]|nr:division septum protein Blr [Leptospira borgpetersenii serovar Hardjo-bovis]
MTRLIELTGWIVLVISVILLGIATHIANYHPPEPTASVPTTSASDNVNAFSPRTVRGAPGGAQNSHPP